MDFQIKLFSWPDKGDHLIMITRELLDRTALEQYFKKWRRSPAPCETARLSSIYKTLRAI